MSHLKLIVLQCDEPGCGIEYDVATAMAQTARRLAKPDGWLNIHADDFCPRHAAKHAHEKHLSKAQREQAL